MSNIAQTLAERAKSDNKGTSFRENNNGFIKYKSYDSTNYLNKVINHIIDRISQYYLPFKDYDNDYGEYQTSMYWNETYDTVCVAMTLDIPFWSIYVNNDKLDYIVCDMFNKKLNDIGFRLYTIPEIYYGSDGVGGPDSMSFILKVIKIDI